MTLINGDRAKNLVSGEDNSIGGNMVNDSSLGSTKVASFAANGDYTLQAKDKDGNSAGDLTLATQFVLELKDSGGNVIDTQTVARAGDEGNGFLTKKTVNKKEKTKKTQHKKEKKPERDQAIK